MKIFAQQIEKEKALVYDLRAVIDGESRYFIIKVPPSKRAAFIKAVEKDSGFRLEDYGDVLHKGLDEPDAALKQLLHEQYRMYEG